MLFASNWVNTYDVSLPGGTKVATSLSFAGPLDLELMSSLHSHTRITSITCSNVEEISYLEMPEFTTQTGAEQFDPFNLTTSKMTFWSILYTYHTSINCSTLVTNSNYLIANMNVTPAVRLECVLTVLQNQSSQAPALPVALLYCSQIWILAWKRKLDLWDLSWL